VEKEKLLARLRRQYPWLDHLVRANEAFTQRYGKHYAAAVTYFSVLSVIPILMVGFAIVGFVVMGDEVLIGQLRSGIRGSVPDGLDDVVSSILDVAVESGGGLGFIGLLLALYSGIGWMSNLRDALTAQWNQPKPQLPIVSKTLKDLVSLVGLGAALVFSFTLTAVGSALGENMLDWVGLAGQGWARTLLRIVTILLTLLANLLVFLWVIARLPRGRVAWRGAVKGAALASVGFVALQQLATLYLAGVGDKPAFAVFGPVLGLLIFANLVSRMLLFVTAWTSTATENRSTVQQPPPPVTIRPNVVLNRGIGPRGAVGLFGIGALLGWLGHRKR